MLSKTQHSQNLSNNGEFQSEVSAQLTVIKIPFFSFKIKVHIPFAKITRTSIFANI
jgi:hypothetical protein